MHLTTKQELDAMSRQLLSQENKENVIVDMMKRLRRIHHYPVANSTWLQWALYILSFPKERHDQVIHEAPPLNLRPLFGDTAPLLKSMIQSLEKQSEAWIHHQVLFHSIQSRVNMLKLYNANLERPLHVLDSLYTTWQRQKDPPIQTKRVLKDMDNVFQNFHSL
jgi:hypothetical protein